MRKITTLFALFAAIPLATNAQDYIQYFDGADTLFSDQYNPQSILIELEADSNNIWQIGMPQKTIFDAAATFPNALVTDTLSNYPTGDTSRFEFTLVPWTSWGVLAVQWKQKIDMRHGLDGGNIEFSVDEGDTWESAFNSPYVYNFYGFEAENQDTLINGDMVFTGVDSTWRDIWLCYDMSWASSLGSIRFRYTFTSDANPVNATGEGWMIDNLYAHITVWHSVNEKKRDHYLKVYPNPASDQVRIDIEKQNEFHIIEHMRLINHSGELVGEWHTLPTNFFIDVRSLPNGMYTLVVQTNIKTETVSISVQH